MKYLTIDTTTRVTALALAADGRLVGEGFLHSERTHSERLLPLLDQLLQAADWRLADLDLIAVVRGPGSFTGIRIGIATAQGLAQVLSLPLLGIVSLDALAWAACGREGLIVPLLDARKNEWYTGIYRWDPRRQHPFAVRPPQAHTPQALVSELEHGKEPIWFVGDAVVKAEAFLRDNLGERAHILPDYVSLPRGAYAVKAAWDRWQEGTAGETVEPLYLRLSEAEVNWAKKEQARRKGQ